MRRDDYSDILHLPHHISSSRAQMPMSDRAAQFSPFAALNGYDAAIKETGRLTDSRLEMTEDEQSILDQKYQMLVERLEQNQTVQITYFKKDDRKEGGAYLTISGIVRKIDSFERLLYMVDQTVIDMDNIVDISFDGEYIEKHGM